ncbi:MAG: hypothetical protein ABWZ52_11830 [Acidimicrobiales bacterium]
MPDAPTPNRTRLAATAGLLGAATVAALVLGAGPAPSVLQLAGASDDVADDVSGNCDEAEHANDPACQGTTDDAATTSSTVIGTTSTSVDGTTSTTAGGGAGGPADEIRSLDAAGAGIVIYAIEGDNLRLVTATPASGWAVEVEQRTGREVELDFRSGAQRVQVNVEIEDGQVRERVRVRDDADDTDVRIENGVVVRDDSPDDDSSGPGRGNDDSDDDSNSGSGHGGDDDGHASDDDSGSGHGGSGSG